MSYTTTYLKADDYDTFYAACETAGLVSDGEVITSSHNHSLVLLGTIYKNTGKTLTDEDGNEYPEKQALDGYHANLRYKESVGLELLAVEVEIPAVTFA